jgi:hypothetical protein
MTWVSWLIIVAGALLVGYIAIEVYTRWYSMAQEIRKLREDVNELRGNINQELRLAKQEAYQRYDSIYKSLADLQEDIGRLKEWQIKIDKIVADYPIASQEPQEQQVPYHQVPKRATKKRKL